MIAETQEDRSEGHACFVQVMTYPGSYTPCNGDLQNLHDLSTQTLTEEETELQGIKNMADLLLSRAGIFDWRE